MLVEFIIDTGNDQWRWRMIRYLIFSYVLIAILIACSFFGNAIVLLSWAAAILLGSTVWAYYKTRLVLYRLSFDNETKQVTVDVVLINELNKRFVIPFEAFHVKIVNIPRHKRRTKYILEIYENQELLYKQYDVCGWSRDDFNAIQEYATLMIPGKRK